MSEEIDKHVLKKYEVQQRLGKGVSARSRRLLLRATARKRRQARQHAYTWAASVASRMHT